MEGDSTVVSPRRHFVNVAPDANVPAGARIADPETGFTGVRRGRPEGRRGDRAARADRDVPGPAIQEPV